MSEGGTELLAITSAAVEPLLMTDYSNNNIHSEDGEEGTTMENIENGGTYLEELLTCIYIYSIH